MSDSHSTKKKIIGVVGALAICIGLVVYLGKTKSHDTYEVGLDPKDLYFNNTIIGGKKYTLKNISTYILLGVDKEGDINVYDKTHEQSDLICYVVVNHDTQKYDVLNINRDCLTLVYQKGFDEYSSISKSGRIAEAHAWGSTESSRCQNVLNSLKILFDGSKKTVSVLPNADISHTFSFTMGAIASFMEVAGQFDVTVTDEMIYPNHSDVLGQTNGEILTITKDNAESFVRDSDTSIPGRNATRMVRQNAFIKGFMAQLKTKNNLTYDLLTSGVEDKIYCGLSIESFDSLLSACSEYEFGKMLTLNGEYASDSDNFAPIRSLGEGSIEDFLTTYIYDLAA